MPRTWSFAGLMMLLAVAAAEAQFPDAIREGARVRLVLADSATPGSSASTRDFVVGNVVARTPDTLYLTLRNTVGTLTVPRSTVRALDLSLGRAPRRERAIRFGAQYAALGALAFLAIHGTGEHGTFGTRTTALAYGALYGLGFGVYIGTRPVERWREVPLTH